MSGNYCEGLNHSQPLPALGIYIYLSSHAKAKANVNGNDSGEMVIYFVSGSVASMLPANELSSPIPVLLFQVFQPKKCNSALLPRECLLLALSNIRSASLI